LLGIKINTKYHKCLIISKLRYKILKTKITVMKKVFTLSVLLFTIVCVANAQTQKGNLLVGANISNFEFNFSEGANTFGMTITPKVGFFIKDNIALGPVVSFGLLTGKDVSTTFNYGVGAFGRYFVSDKSTEIVKGSRFFFEADAGFNGVNVSGGTSTNGIGFGFGPGLAWFATPSVALEALLKYNFTIGFGNSTINNRLGLGIGLQVYLPSKKAREMIKKEVPQLDDQKKE
jgi:hypothetical protein